MKVSKKLIVLLLSLVIAAATGLAATGCSAGNKKVESIEITNSETTLTPGEYVITAKCLPKKSDQTFKAQVKGIPRSVSIEERDGGYVLVVGKNAVNKTKIAVVVTSLADTGITAQKEFTLDIPALAYTMIHNEDDLFAMKNDLSGIYKLANDITLTKNWVQLGDAEHQPDNALIIPAKTPFKGILDGNGYSIKNINMTVNEPNQNGYDHGFFGQIDTFAAVRNLGLDGGKMNFHGWSGVLAAQNLGEITNVFTNVELYVKGGVAAAMVVTNSGTITNCYAYGKTVTESEDANTEGFVGVPGGTITNCFVDKEVSGIACFSGFRLYYNNEYDNKTYLLNTEKMQTVQTFEEIWPAKYWDIQNHKYPAPKHL